VRAIAQIAVHDALNAIEPRYERYTGPARAHHDASPDAAVAAAARQTLLELLAPLPDSALKQAAIDRIETTYAVPVGPEPYDAATQAGIDAGTAAQALKRFFETDEVSFSTCSQTLPVAKERCGGTVVPCPSLLIAIGMWKMATEALFMTAGALPFEWIERAGSYMTPLALYYAVATKNSR
jgi:hypothetical protein